MSGLTHPRAVGALRRVVVGLGCLLLVVACGGGPADTGDQTGGQNATAAAPQASGTEPAEETPAAEPSEPLEGYEAVLAEIEGLDADARWQRLVELAEQEDGTLQIYATIGAEEMDPIVDGFLEAAGSDSIDVTFYRGGTNDVMRRIMEEESAGRRQMDAIIAPGTSLVELTAEDLLQEFDTPVGEDLLEGSMYPNWGSIYINLYTAAWNTDLVSGTDVPTTWEDVLTHDSVAVEVKSYDWFATLVTDYFMPQGMSEDEAVALFADANMVPVDGRTALTELTVAGQFDIAASTYTHNVDKFVRDGAPIAWEPPVQPLILQPNGVAPVRDSDVPATALLFVDYLLSQPGQEVLASFERIPTNTTVEGSVPTEYDIVSIDVNAMVDDRARWEDLFATVTGEPSSSG